MSRASSESDGVSENGWSRRPSLFRYLGVGSIPHKTALHFTSILYSSDYIILMRWESAIGTWLTMWFTLVRIITTRELPALEVPYVWRPGV